MRVQPAAVRMGGGEEAAEMGVAFAVLGREGEVRFVLHSDLGAKDGLDAIGMASLGELDGGADVVMVRHGERRHSQLRRPLNKRLDLARAVQEAMGGVDVSV